MLESLIDATPRPTERARLPKMRLLLVTGEFPDMIGGVADHSLRLGTALAEAGHRIQVLTVDDPRVARLPGLDVRAGLSSSRALPRLCAEGRPDVVVFQYVQYLYQRYGLPASLVPALRHLRRQVPLIVVGHELFVPWGGLRALPFWIGQRLVSLALLRQASAVVLSTERRVAQMRPFLPPRCRLELIRVGASLPDPPEESLTVQDATPEARDDLFRVGMFASLQLDWRRPDVAVEAVRLLGVRDPSRRVELVLMGRLAENTRRYLDAVPPAGPGYRIETTGVLPMAEVERRLLDCDVAVVFDQSGVGGIASRSTSVATALCLGRPLLANRGRETDSIFEDGRNVVFCRLDAEDAAAKLDALRRNEERRRALRQGARQLFDRHFRWSVIAASFEALCLDLVASPSGE